MKRAQVYFHDEEVYEALRAASFQQHRSMSYLVEQWVREKTLGAPKQKRYAAGLLELAKRLKLHDTVKDISERHDEYAWGGDT